MKNNKLSNIKTFNEEILIFDLDGTLTDPKEGIVNSIKYALSKYGIEEDDEKFLQKFIGPSLYDSFKDFYSFDEKEVIKVVESYREYFSKHGMYENKVYPGVMELLKSLKEKDKKLLIATTKPTVFAKEIIKFFNMEDFFLDIYGSNLDGTRVSKAELIDIALKNFEDGANRDDIGDRNEDAVMVGDRKYDVIGAKKNGIKCIGVLYGYGTEDELEAAGPDYIVDSVEELKEILLK